jgi:aspartate kinase
MLEKLKVKKWWGENAGKFDKSPLNVASDYKNWNKQLLVVSAIRTDEFNTTDNLIELANLLKPNSDHSPLWDAMNAIVKNKIEDIKNFHINLLEEKLWLNSDIKDKIFCYFEYFIKIIDDWFLLWEDTSKIYPNKKNDYSINYLDNSFSLIWFWEDLSAFIQVELINNLNINWLKAKKIDLSLFSLDLNNLEEDTNVFTFLSWKLRDIIEPILRDNIVPVISWYIPWFEDWIENMIWRGYSDATAWMVCLWLNDIYDITFEVQKSVLGMLSADPKLVKNPKLIEKIDYLTAKEITWIRWSQAKLLHSQVLRKEILDASIKIKLFDPFSDSVWTIISWDKCTSSNWIEYIWSRNNIIFFSISFSSMSDSWILSKIFDVLDDYNISVDIVSTSETEVSFTVDSNIDDDILDNVCLDIRKSLNFEKNDNINFVRYEKNKALIFLVWQNLINCLWILARAALAFEKWGINIKLISQWTMERSVVFWIDSKNMKKVVNLLHDEFIN